MSRLCALILTYNESKHIQRCIGSLREVADEVIVVDSFSTDDTPQIARELGARVYQNVFVNYATQYNWALDEIPISAEWTLRIDADEYLTPALAAELGHALRSAPRNTTGFIYRRCVTFLRQRVRFGGFGGQWVLRCWRTGLARCENRWMDEHMVLEHGATKRLRHVVVDDNLNDISWWTRKHIGYAAREAIDLLQLRHSLQNLPKQSLQGAGLYARTKRWLKQQIYARLPLGLRPVLYFSYRMLPQLGVLDGPKGWAFHFMQGLWYRTLVDIRVWEVEQAMRNANIPVIEAIKQVLDIDLRTVTATE